MFFTFEDIGKIPPKIIFSQQIFRLCRVFHEDCVESFMKDSTQSASIHCLKIKFFWESLQCLQV
jgi:NADPH-dependent 7-cyano-7-deazaguanine reductase QueF